MKIFQKNWILSDTTCVIKAKSKSIKFYVTKAKYEINKI